MNYDYKKQAQEYLNIYWDSNKDSIIDRLTFLIKEFDGLPDYLGPADIWYYFEEARHTFMMGDFIASIILSACTIELWMSNLLEIPFYSPRGSVIEIHEYSFKKLVDCCANKRLIDNDEKRSLYILNKLRTFYVHGKDIDNKFVYKRESKKRVKFWNSKLLANYWRIKSVENDAKKSIKILFKFYRNHNYLKELNKL